MSDTLVGSLSAEVGRLTAELAGARNEAAALQRERDYLGFSRATDIRMAVELEREACATLAEAQSFFPDTHTGARQQWVKEQIAAAIRARWAPP